MFATVEVRDAPGGAKTFFRDLFLLPEIELIRVNVPFGEAFYRVIVTEYRGQVPVEDIRRWAIAAGIPMIVESEGLIPSGTEEARNCINFLKSLDAKDGN